MRPVRKINLHWLCHWLLLGTELPTDPYKLRPGHYVGDPGKFHETLRNELLNGMPAQRVAPFVEDLAGVHAAAVRAGTAPSLN